MHLLPSIGYHGIGGDRRAIITKITTHDVIDVLDVSYSDISDIMQDFCNAIMGRKIITLNMSGLDLTDVDWRIIHGVKHLLIRICYDLSPLKLAAELMKSTSLITLDMIDTSMEPYSSYLELVDAIVNSRISTLGCDRDIPMIFHKLQKAVNLRTLYLSVYERYPGAEWNNRYMPIEDSKCDAIYELIKVNRNIVNFKVKFEFGDGYHNVLSQKIMYNCIEIQNVIALNKMLHISGRQMCTQSALALYVSLRATNSYIFNKDVTSMIAKIVGDTINYQLWRDTCLRINPDI